MQTTNTDVNYITWTYTVQVIKLYQMYQIKFVYNIPPMQSHDINTSDSHAWRQHLFMWFLTTVWNPFFIPAAHDFCIIIMHTWAYTQQDFPQA